MLTRFLPEPPRGHTVVIGAGKAAASMAAALEAAWPGPLSGVVVTRYGHGADISTKAVRVLEAAHPVPDAAGVAATQEILRSVAGLGADDLVLCLLSGGGSALLCGPSGVTLDQKAALTEQLLRCGASIDEMNAVRKHLSKVKGGQLAAACAPARVVSLIVSDVVGDDLSTIASGPTAPDPSTYTEAVVVLDRYRLAAPEARRHLVRGALGEYPETPKPGDPGEDRVQNHIIVSGASALGAAAAVLTADGLSTRILSDQITGPARRAAKDHARAIRAAPPGTALLSGGETTTVVPEGATGRGGRNLEFLLALALELGEGAGVYALAADTDGIDGSSDAAGAIITPDTLSRARQLGLDARAYLEGADAHGFFERLGDLVVTGPTGTNVNDFRLLLRG